MLLNLGKIYSNIEPAAGPAARGKLGQVRHAG